MFVDMLVPNSTRAEIVIDVEFQEELNADGTVLRTTLKIQIKTNPTFGFSETGL